MQVSVIIPTYNRVKDLDECLDSIIVQITLPEEVIIVDDSDNNEIEDLIKNLKGEFKEKDILLRYIKNERERSLTIARNIGIENANGDIISFLDSDVILDRNYIKEISRFLKENPYALGVQGRIQNIKKLDVVAGSIFTKLFYFGFKRLEYPLTAKVIRCKWLSGANQSYKKDILEEFRWDENLKKYSWGEDIDLPYRIFKKYPYSLFMIPHAKLIHKTSQEGRIPKRDVIRMGAIYNLYIFYKNIDQNLKNKIIYLWGEIGRIIINMVFLVLKPSKSKLIEIKYLISAYFYCMKHIKEIKEGDLEFFNKGLK